MSRSKIKFSRLSLKAYKMANFKEQSGWCPNCNRQVLARKEQTNNTFWLIATLFSCGLFIIFWFFDELSKTSKPFLCVQCGSAVGNKPANSRPTLSPAMQQLAMNTSQFNPAYQTNAPAYQPSNNSSGLKCFNCGLTNFATEANCKRCKNPLR